MRGITDFLAKASRRLQATRFLSGLSVALAVGAGIALCLVITTKALPSFVVPWIWAGPALALVAVGAASIWTRSTRPSQARVALLVDERLDLRERLTTALCCVDRDDAFARAAVEDAVTVVQDPKLGQLLSRRVRVQGPKHWFIAPLLAATAAGASALPAFDVFGKAAVDLQPQVQEAKYAADAAITDVAKSIEESPALRDELAEALGDLTQQGLDPKSLETPEAIKRDAIKRMTELSQKLDELLNGDKAKTADALKQAMSQLKTPEDGAAKELAEAMQKGDFSAAQEALKQLQEKLEKGQLNEADKQQLQQQLQDMANQMEKLAQQQKALEEALKQAGLDPQLAQNQQALQQAIQNNPNLNQQQQQQLQQMAQAQQQACQMCQKMGGACGKMAQQMQNAAGQKAGQCGQQLQQMLNDAEMMQQMLQQAQAAAKQCQGQCQGMGQCMSMQQMLAQQQCQGKGMGNRGIGAGGQAPISPTPTGSKAQKENTKIQENAEIIAKQFIQGDPIVGEAKTKLQKVAAQVDQTYEEGLAEDTVNPRYREAHRRYFGEVRSRIDKTRKNTEQAAPSGTNAPVTK